jgi:hypothetical protein
VTNQAREGAGVARLHALPNYRENSNLAAKGGVPELPQNGRDMHTFTYFRVYGTVGFSRWMQKFPGRP